MIHAVLEPLLAYLTLTDIFRLHRALGRTPGWPPYAARSLCIHRLRCSARGLGTMRALARHMSETQSRCVACGAHTRRVRRVCDACGRDDVTWGMCTRAQLRDRVRDEGWAMRGLERRFRQLPVVQRQARTRAFLYWRRQAEVQLASE